MRSLRKDIKSGSRFQDERRYSPSNIFLSPVPQFRLAEIFSQKDKKDNEDKNKQKLRAILFSINNFSFFTKFSIFTPARVSLA